MALLDGTFIDARGYDGLSDTTAGKEKSAPRTGAAGGDIQIGGNYLGQGDTPAALNLYVDPGVLVLNDAINSGDAGRTIFWSDDTTDFHGNVYARSLGGKGINKETWNANEGGNSGDGGFVETSGHKHLDAHGHVDTTASNGETGTYLLDPANIAIYGNFNPKYASTDGSINLAPNLKLWLDANGVSGSSLAYQGVTSLTLTGATSGSSTISVISATGLTAGAQIKIGGMIGNAYTIASISGKTLTLTTPLTSSFTPMIPVYAGYASYWIDGSGNSNNATTSTASSRPLWVGNSQNSKATLKFDGANDGFNVNLSFLNDATSGSNGIPHTSFVAAKTTTYGSFYQDGTPYGDFYEGFSSPSAYKMDFAGNTLASTGTSSGSTDPSQAFTPGQYNVITYKWLPDTGRPISNQIYLRQYPPRTNRWCWHHRALYHW